MRPTGVGPHESTRSPHRYHTLRLVLTEAQAPPP